MKAKPITYHLMIQCVRSEIGVMAEYVATTPFPPYTRGDSLELLDCEPRTWDVCYAMHRITADEKGNVFCSTVVMADSSVVENTGYVVVKQNGETVGPSSTRFGRIKV